MRSDEFRCHNREGPLYFKAQTPFQDEKMVLYGLKDYSSDLFWRIWGNHSLKHEDSKEYWR